MAIYQGTPLPRTRTRHTAPRRAAPSPRIPDRPPVPVRMLSRPATPAYGVAAPRVAVPRDDPAPHAARLRAMAGPRPRIALTGVAVILAVTLVGLFYLSQTFAAAASRQAVQQLLVERQVMLRGLQTQQAAAQGAGSQWKVTQWAQASNLQQLGGHPYTVTAR